VSVATLTLRLAGADCASEAQSPERILARAPGVRSVYVNPITNRATVEADERVDLDAIAELARDAGAVVIGVERRPGGTSGPMEPQPTESEREYRRLMRKWWFAVAVGAPTMVLSYPWLLPVVRAVRVHVSGTKEGMIDPRSRSRAAPLPPPGPRRWSTHAARSHDAPEQRGSTITSVSAPADRPTASAISGRAVVRCTLMSVSSLATTIAPPCGSVPSHAANSRRTASAGWIGSTMRYSTR
jgi:copper chaperone CopZ